MSFQLTILKILEGHPEGRTSLAELKRYMAVLLTSGPEWTARMKRLESLAGGSIDIFSQALVVRDNAGWEITAKGRAFLAALERPTVEQKERTLEELIEHSPIVRLPALPVSLERGVSDRKRRRGGRARTARERRRSA